MTMKKWLHTAMSSTVSIRMLLQERACCGVPCRMPLILGESISSYPGASFVRRLLLASQSEDTSKHTFSAFLILHAL
jgi:hypothetical protein